MKLLINGQATTLDQMVKSVADLLIALGHKGAWYAVAINGDFIPRESYDSTLLNENDDVEIVTPHPGG